MPKYYGYEIDSNLDAPHVPGWTDGRILELLDQWAQDKDIVVEIGSFKGRSAVTLAQACSGTLYCIDEWLEDHGDERRPERELPIEIYKQFLAHMAHFGFLSGRVVPIASSSTVAYRMFTSIPIDMIYIDGSHSYEGVMSDLDHWYDLVVVGGIVCGDDYGMPSVHRAVKDFADWRHLSIDDYIDGKLWRLVHS